MNTDKIPPFDARGIDGEFPNAPPSRRSGTINVSLEYAGHTKPLPEPDVDFIEDDFPRPNRPSGTIQVTLEYAGHSKPMLPDDPKDYE